MVVLVHLLFYTSKQTSKKPWLTFNCEVNWKLLNSRLFCTLTSWGLHISTSYEICVFWLKYVNFAKLHLVILDIKQYKYTMKSMEQYTYDKFLYSVMYVEIFGKRVTYKIMLIS